MRVRFSAVALLATAAACGASTLEEIPPDDAGPEASASSQPIEASSDSTASSDAMTGGPVADALPGDATLDASTDSQADASDAADVADASPDVDASDAAPPVTFLGATIALTHTQGCALSEVGAVKCWGQGHGASFSMGAPEDRDVGIPSGAVALEAATYSMCAVMASGGLKCWGLLSLPPAGSWESYDTAVDVEGVQNARGVAMFSGGACYFDDVGDVRCFGALHPFPISTGLFKIQGLPPIKALSANGDHVCGVSVAEEVWCWGTIGQGSLGDGLISSSATPIKVTGLSAVKKIASGTQHMCALGGDGRVRCWNLPFPGDGGSFPITPQLVDGVGSATAISAGYSFACAREITGAVKCWGLDYGAMGDGMFDRGALRATPSTVSGLTGQVGELASAVNGSCARSGNLIECWGHGPTDDAISPLSTKAVTVSGLTGVETIAAHDRHVCAAKKAGGLACWGNRAGTADWLGLGDGTAATHRTPLDLSLPGTVTTIATARSFTCASTSAGKVWCWGADDLGQIGNGAATVDERSPPQELALLNIDRILVTVGAACGWTGTETSCWGNRSRHLAFPEGTTPSFVVSPERHATLDGFREVHAGPESGCGIDASNQVSCWGNLVLTTIPQAIVGGGDAVSIRVGDRHACLLTSLGRVKCWGENMHGQSGVVTQATDVGLSDVVGIDAHDDAACAVRSSGEVYCWGTLTFWDSRWSIAPRLIPGFDAKPIIRIGGPGVCAISKSDTVQCYGSDVPPDMIGLYGTDSPWRTAHAVSWQ